MAVLIDEFTVDAAPAQQAQSAPAQSSAPVAPPDVRRTLTVLHERQRRLKAD